MTRMSKDALLARLEPILAVARTADLSRPDEVKRSLDAQFPLESLADLRALLRKGVEERWLCDREAPAPDGGAPVRYSRVQKASEAMPFSVDAVHMSGPGGGHTHPSGEIDLCFSVGSEARFDGQPDGWTVYAPGTWHVPTVSAGAMDILYFLPRGEIRFEPRPA